MSSFNDNGNFSNLPAGTFTHFFYIIALYLIHLIVHFLSFCFLIFFSGDYQFFVQDSRGCSTSAAVAAGTGGTSVPLQLTVRDMGM